MTSLFDTATFGKIPLRNRLLMAPMTRNRATPEGAATALMAEYYAQRATSGLIITEGVQPSQVGQGFINTPGLHTPEQVASWRTVTDAVHAQGGRIMVQLMHSGRIGHPSLYASAHEPVAPSPVRAAGRQFTPEGLQEYLVPRELTTAEIDATVRDFADAARGAMEAGFDGVQIHAGNGFLLHQFLSENTNHRTDAYGGSVANRIRFTVEVTEAVTAAVGNEHTAVRVSPGNPYNDIAEGDTEALYAALVPALPELAFLEAQCWSLLGDGRRVTSLDADQDEYGTVVGPAAARAAAFPGRPTGLIPLDLGGMRDSLFRTDVDLYLTELPPPGETRLVVEWPDEDIPETSTPVDADALRAAAAHAVEVWPGLPTPRATGTRSLVFTRLGGPPAFLARPMSGRERALLRERKEARVRYVPRGDDPQGEEPPGEA